MRLAIDLRPFLSPWISGVTVLTRQFIQLLQQEGEWDLDLFYFAAERYEPIHDVFLEARYIPISNRAFHLQSALMPLHLPSDFFPIQPDLIWIPDRRPFFKTSIPIVMTVHDDVPERRSDTLSLRARVFHRLFSVSRYAKQVSAWIAPSQTSADFIHSFSQAPVHVSYAPFELSRVKPCAPLHSLPSSFVFCLAPLDPRKGLNHVLKLLDLDPELNVVWAGIKPMDTRFAPRRTPHHPQLICLPEITEEEKIWLFQHARAFLALSEWEGFDLPVLEAVTQGCPVLLSDIPVHRELYRAQQYSSSPRQSLDLLRSGDLKVSLRFNPDPRVLGHRFSLFLRRVIGHENG